MIHVDPQPEPPGFAATVREPGLRALAEGKEPLPPHWRACLPDLHERYRGVCAYLCVHIPRGTGARSVDHVAPKSKRRDRAYEWDNYRLVMPAPGLDEATRTRVRATIDRLGLNDEECIAARALYYQPYVEGHLTPEMLAEWSPFVAQQARRPP